MIDNLPIKHFDQNPRTITKKQFERLQKTMQEFGDLSGIVINIKQDEQGDFFGELVGGNQRSEAAQFINSTPVFENRYDPPLDDGTVATGYYEYKGRRFNCRFVQWDDAKALDANLIANAGGGDWNWDILANIDAGVLSEAGFDRETLMASNNNAMNLLQFLNSQGEVGEIDFGKEWEGMPEFEQENKIGIVLIVHFENKEDREAFFEKMGYKQYTDITKSVWYPEKKRGDQDQTGRKEGLVYTNES